MKLSDLPEKLAKLIKSGLQLRVFDNNRAGNSGTTSRRFGGGISVTNGQSFFAATMVPAATSGQYGQMTDDIEKANLMTSKNIGDSRLGDTHSILLDIDRECYLLPSSTEGHYHLIIPAALEWDKYNQLLYALARAGVIQQGYADAANSKGYTSLRLPWIKKPPGWETGAVDPTKNDFVWDDGTVTPLKEAKGAP